jgi:hypothetical protein
MGGYYMTRGDVLREGVTRGMLEKAIATGMLRPVKLGWSRYVRSEVERVFRLESREQQSPRHRNG